LLQGTAKIEEAFLAALLHNLGKLAFMDNFPAQYRTACEAARRKSQPLSEAEREVFQASHAEVGGYLLHLWAMPEDVIEAVIHQNHPPQSNHSEFSALTALYAGNIISRKLRPPDPFVTPEWDMSYLESIGCQNCVKEWEESCASLLRKNRTRD
jgi:HD-like signal output (HDOD) protein